MKGVISAWRERMATADAFQRQPCPFAQTISLYSLVTILGAGRQEPAGRWDSGREEPLVQSYGKKACGLHCSIFSFGSVIAAGFSRRRALARTSFSALVICRKSDVLAPTLAVRSRSQPSRAVTERAASLMRRLTRFLSTALPICFPTLKAYRVGPS